MLGGGRRGGSPKNENRHSRACDSAARGRGARWRDARRLAASRPLTSRLLLEEAIRLKSGAGYYAPLTLLEGDVVEAFQPPSVETKPARVGWTAAGREPEK